MKCFVMPDIKRKIHDYNFSEEIEGGWDLRYSRSQITYIIREAVRSVIDYKVIDPTLRDAILYYLCFKFSLCSENLVSRRVIELLESLVNMRRKTWKSILIV